MRRNQGRVSRDSTVSFLLFEARFPRSLRYCLRSAIALSKRLVVPNLRGGAAVALIRLEALDRWLDQQEQNGVPLSVHALLTHVVDEAGAACGDLQGGLEGDLIPAPARRPEAAQ